MASLKQLKGCTSYEDLNKTTITNIISCVSGSTTSSVQPPMDPKERKRQRERDRYAQLSGNQKDELLRKRREARQQKKIVAAHVNVKHHDETRSGKSLQKQLQRIPATSDGDARCNKENMAYQSHQDITMGKNYIHVQQLTTEQIEARRAKCRARYANLTSKQRQAIRDRQRLLYANMTSEQKQAKRNSEKARRVLRRNTLSKESIAMVNPMYNSSDSE